MAGQCIPSAAPDARPDPIDYWNACGAVRGADVHIGARQQKYAALFEDATSVVDLGCGRGEFLALLRSRGVSALGVDSAAGSCAACADAGLTAVQADVLDFLQRDSAPLGGVFNAGLLEHLDRPDVESLIARVAERLTPGGLFVSVLPNPASLLTHLQLFHEDPTHVRFYPIRYLSELCRRSGLDVVQVAEDADTLAGWGGHFGADFSRFDDLRQRDPAVGVLVSVVRDLATHFNTVMDQFVRPLEFYIVARKPHPSRIDIGADQSFSLPA